MRRGRVRTVGLAIMLLGDLQVGLWARLAPRSFHESFPGGGRAWVSAVGPYNEHLITDFGAMNLALAVTVLVALVTRERIAAISASAAALVFTVPHLVFHLGHQGTLTSSDQLASLVTIGFTVAVPLVVLLDARRRDDRPV